MRRNYQLHWIVFFVLLLTISFISANLIKADDTSLNFPFQSLEFSNHHQQILIPNTRLNINYFIKVIQRLAYCPVFFKLAGSVLVSPDLKVILQLLCSTQLFVLFFIFYQISRTNSESDLP